MKNEPVNFKKHPLLSAILLIVGFSVLAVLLLTAVEYMTSTHCYSECQFSDGNIDSCEYIMTSRGIATEITGCKSGTEYRGVTNYKILRTYCESD